MYLDVRSLPPLKRIVLLSLGATLTAVGAFVTLPIPFSPVPLVLQNFFVLLLGLVFGANLGAASVALYLFIGILGLPVFAGAKGGFSSFMGPTGGYLVGYLASAFVTGLFAYPRPAIEKPIPEKPDIPAGDSCKIHHRKKRLFFRDLGAALGGIFVIYAFGVPWLKLRFGFDWEKALGAGLLPFIPGDILKAVAAAVIAPGIRTLLSEEFVQNDR